MAYIKDGAYCPDDYKDEECDSCFSAEHPKPQKILLECGYNPQDAIFEIYDGCVKRDQAFVLDRVVVDTTCLVRPLIKIEFSSLVFFEAEGEGSCEQKIETGLLFELERICNGNKEVLQCWQYEKEIEVKSEKLEYESSEPFTVTFCDRVCPGCCEYKIVVKGKDFKGDFAALRVTKPNLSALAQGQCCE